MLVLLLFAIVWIWLALQVLLYHPTLAAPKVTFADAQINVAGFLSSAVSAGTASVLGIEIQKASTDQNLAAQVGEATKGSRLLSIGIAVYALVGLFVLIVWFLNSAKAPDMIGAFSLGILGWLAGGFTAVFRK
jgi:hypothetical protein